MTPAVALSLGIRRVHGQTLYLQGIDRGRRLKFVDRFAGFKDLEP